MKPVDSRIDHLPPHLHEDDYTARSVDNAWQACPLVPLNVTTLRARDRPAYENARLTYKAWGNGHYQWGLMSKKSIPVHEEILWKYGALYIYPTFD